MKNPQTLHIDRHGDYLHLGNLDQLFGYLLSSLFPARLSLIVVHVHQSRESPRISQWLPLPSSLHIPPLPWEQLLKVQLSQPNQQTPEFFLLMDRSLYPRFLRCWDSQEKLGQHISHLQCSSGSCVQLSLDFQTLQ